MEVLYIKLVQDRDGGAIYQAGMEETVNNEYIPVDDEDDNKKQKGMESVCIVLSHVLKWSIYCPLPCAEVEYILSSHTC